VKVLSGVLVALLVAVTGSCLVLYHIHRAEERFTVPVRGRIPEQFPVLVFRYSESGNSDCRIVRYRELATTRQRSGKTSYLVPQERQETCAAQVRARTRARERPANVDRTTDEPWDAWYKVKQISRTRQAFEVFCTGDDDYMNRSWYEATDDNLFPIQHQFYFGPGLAMQALPASLLQSLLIWVPLLWGYRFVKKRWIRKAI